MGSLRFVAAAMGQGLDGLENARMDFGKHKGELMVELPDSYLTWISRRRNGRLALWASLADRVLDERQKADASSAAAPGKVDSQDVDPIDGFNIVAAVAAIEQMELVDCSERIEGKQEAGLSSQALEIKRNLQACVNSEEMEMEAEEITPGDEAVIAIFGGSKQATKSFQIIHNDDEKDDGEVSTVDHEQEFLPRREPHQSSRNFGSVFQSSGNFGSVSLEERADLRKTIVAAPRREKRRKTVGTISDEERLARLVASFDSQGNRSSEHYSQFIRWCGDTRSILDGRFIHSHLMSSHRKNEKFLLNLLVEMYGKWGETLQARTVFEKIRYKNSFSWNAMLEAYVRNDLATQAIELFHEMDLEGGRPNKLSFLALIEAFSASPPRREKLLDLQRRVEDAGFGSDAFLVTCLINLFGKSGMVAEAKRALDRLSSGSRDVIAWTSAIAALARNRHFKPALQLYREMALQGAPPNNMTFLGALDACAGQRDLRSGVAIHAAAVERGFGSNAIVGTSIVNMYGKCGDLDRASVAFASIGFKDAIAWNTIIAAHVENHRPRRALEIFEEMMASRSNACSWARPNSMTFAAALDACSLAAASLAYGRSIHARIRGAGLESDLLVANSLLEMYIKCGSLSEARGVFDTIQSPTGASFTTIISGYAHQGDAGEALALLWRMQQEGVVPTYVTFIVILCVCSHRGMVEEGWSQFVAMTLDYGIAPMKEHLNCMADLFARSPMNLKQGSSVIRKHN